VCFGKVSVRAVLALHSIVLLAACGQSGAFAEKGVKDPETSAAIAIANVTIADAAPPPPSVTTAIGPLDNAGALKHWFERLAMLDDGGSNQDVRVVQFGDSHTAADLESGTVRRSLQARFGDGGRGFVELGRPWKTYIQDGLKLPGMNKDWAPERGKLDHGKFVGDGCYGIGGVCLVTNKKGARAWADIVAPSSSVELAYLEQPQGGTLELFVDNTSALKVSTKGKANASAFKAVTVPEGPHHLEVQALGDGDVRLFGVSLDRGQIGLVWNALGINGARASTVLQWSESHMQEQLQHQAPDLVVLAYGTNESADDGSLETFERQLVDVLGRVARAVPSASCLLLGPPDRAVETSTGWMTSPKLEQVVEVERAVAHAAGCAFYDQYQAMGGNGSIAAWADETPPRAQKDHVHLTRDGYAFVGQAFADDLVRSYAAWRADKGMSPARTPAPRTPSTAPENHDDKPPASSPFVAIPM
jgi:lysophospholipase L1-like esterase